MGYKEDIKSPVKKISKEITLRYVREIAKEATKRTIKKQTQKLKEQEILKLEDGLKRLSDKNRIDQFRGSGDEISKEISKESIKDKELINKVDNVFEKNFESKIPSLLGGKGLPLAIKIIIVAVLVLGIYYLIIPHPPPPPLTPPPISEISIFPDPLSFDFEERRFEGGGTEKPAPQTFSISNAGGGTLTWSVSSDQPWIILSPTSGINSRTVTIDVNTDGLSAGRHIGLVTLDSNGGTKTGTINVNIVFIVG